MAKQRIPSSRQRMASLLAHGRVLTTLVSIVTCGAISASLHAYGSRPNFVFIIADDLRYDLLGCTGHPMARTPHIDRIASEGVSFRNFFATTPLCSPSRAGFLTGVYAHQNRIINNDSQGLDVVSHRLMTFPRILREQADYVTGWVGKWHMGFDDTRRPGFDSWVSFRGQGQFVDPVVNVQGERIQTKGYLTDLITDWSIDFLEQQGTGPFCLVVAHEAVHKPFLPAARHERDYEHWDVEPPRIQSDQLSGKRALTRELPRSGVPHWFGLHDASPEPPEPRRGRANDFVTLMRDQLRCLNAVDDSVGRIVDALERADLLDNTVLVFTSDHGYLHGEFGVFNEKRWAYDPCLRVPCLIRFPPHITAGTVVDEMALNIDICPTFLELAGVSHDANLHGKSLVPLFAGPDSRQTWRHAILIEHFLEQVGPRFPRYFAVRTRDWKYIHYPDLRDMDELYDLAQDPGENVNQANLAAYAEQLATMRQELQRLNEATDNPFALSLADDATSQP